MRNFYNHLEVLIEEIWDLKDFFAEKNMAQKE